MRDFMTFFGLNFLVILVLSYIFFNVVNSKPTSRFERIVPFLLLIAIACLSLIMFSNFYILSHS